MQPLVVVSPPVLGPPYLPKFWDCAALVATDHMAGVVAASGLRRAGIACETFLTGSARRQWDKAKAFEVVVLIDECPVVVIDRVLGGRIAVDAAGLVAAVLVAFDGIDPADGGSGGILEP